MGHTTPHCADATPIDALKKIKEFPTGGGLRKYSEIVHGNPKDDQFKAAQRNRTLSLEAYLGVVFLGLKDRHNNNVMIDTRGHVIFIDFGFALGLAPGHENALHSNSPKSTWKRWMDQDLIAPKNLSDCLWKPLWKLVKVLR
jgi:serine/threonine protein kinase